MAEWFQRKKTVTFVFFFKCNVIRFFGPGVFIKNMILIDF